MRTTGTAQGTSETYRASHVGPVIAVVFFLIIGLGLVVVAVVSAFRSDIVETTGDMVLRIIFTAMLLLAGVAVGAWALRRLPVVLSERFTADATGIHLNNSNGFIDLEWADIRAIRLVVDIGESIGHRSPLLPKAIHRRAITRLEFSLHDREALEALQPMLATVAMKTAASRTDTAAYTHALRILAGAFAPSLDINQYAPRLQSVLHTHAGSAFAGAEMRSF